MVMLVQPSSDLGILYCTNNNKTRPCSEEGAQSPETHHVVVVIRTAP